jgi:hypothetical protein
VVDDSTPCFFGDLWRHYRFGALHPTGSTDLHHFLMAVLRNVWKVIERVLRFVGDIISTTLLVVFYFTIFALFAIPTRLFTDFMRFAPRSTNFITRTKQYDSLDTFLHEG